MTLRIYIATIFPEFFAAPLGLSIPARAAAAGGAAYHLIDPATSPTTSTAPSMTTPSAADRAWS